MPARLVDPDTTTRFHLLRQGHCCGMLNQEMPPVAMNEVPRPAAAAPTAQLVGQAAAQISTLVRDELTLAKLELAEKGKRAGVGGGLFGAAAVLAWFGLALLLTLAVVALDVVWPLWLAVLVVMVVVLAAAGVAALLGRKQMAKANPLVPEDAIAGMQADIQTVTTAAHEGRHP